MSDFNDPKLAQAFVEWGGGKMLECVRQLAHLLRQEGELPAAAGCERIAKTMVRILADGPKRLSAKPTRSVVVHSDTNGPIAARENGQDIPNFVIDAMVD